jgi:hypothetical protein
MGESRISSIFDRMNAKDKPDYVRHEWAGRKPRWPARENGRRIRLTLEWWALDGEEFDGAWMLAECTNLQEAAAAHCIARMLVVRVAGRAVRFAARSEDLAADIAVTHAYLEQLRLAPIDLWSAKRVLSALLPFDPKRLIDGLLRMSATASGEGLDLSARSLAHVAYDAAVKHAYHRAAQSAALALARLAKLQECPRAARRWRGVAYAHGKRAGHAQNVQTMDE